MEFKIEENIPLTSCARRNGEGRFSFMKDLKVGQSFHMEDAKTKNTAYAYALRNFPGRFRFAQEGTGFRAWCVK